MSDVTRRKVDKVSAEIHNKHRSDQVLVKEWSDLELKDTYQEKDLEAEKDQDPAEKLIESVLKDVYAKEAMAILLDLEKQQKEMASKSTK